MIKNKRNIDVGQILLATFSALIFAFLLVPTVMSVPMSFSDTSFLVFPPQGFTLDWYQKLFSEGRWLKPMLFSLKIASLTTIVCLVIGTLASLALVRGRIPGKRLLHLFFLSPMMTPMIVIAIAVYGLFATFRFIGTTHGMVVAHTIICSPYVILVLAPNLYQFDQNLELAARNLGANPIQTFFYITLPNIKPGIIAAGVFCFIESLDELVLALFLIGTSKMTLPLRMFSEIQFRINPTVAAASGVFIIAAIGTIMAMFFAEKKENRIKF